MSVLLQAHETCLDNVYPHNLSICITDCYNMSVIIVGSYILSVSIRGSYNIPVFQGHTMYVSVS